MAGANVNAADLIDAGKLAGRSDRSAFFLAAQECHISTMRLLLKYRANPDQPTEDGFTPLQVAAQVGNDRVIDFLLEQGVALETLNRHGATALHTACQHGNEYCVSALLAKGAAVNVHSENGASPLMLAASTDTEGHRRCIQLLVEAGAIIDDNVLVAKCSCCGPHCGRNALFALCASSLDHALGELLNSKVRLSPAALRDARRYAKLKRITIPADVWRSSRRSCINAQCVATEDIGTSYAHHVRTFTIVAQPARVITGNSTSKSARGPKRRRASKSTSKKLTE